MKPAKRKILACLLLFPVFVWKVMGQDNSYNIVYQDLAWSPDGNSIAFTVIKVKPDWSDYSPDKWELFIYNLKNRRLEKLSSGCLYISFSPDGENLAYDKTTDDNRDIYSINLRTMEKKKLVDHPAKDGGPSWSPDGKSIVFYSDRDEKEDLFAMEIKSGKVVQLTDHAEYKSYNPVWAPNSDTIVYYLEKGDNKDQIYLTDSRGSFHLNISDDDHHNIFPDWVSDGRIVYARDQGQLMIMNSDGSGKQQLLEKSGDQAKVDPKMRYILTSDEDFNLIIIDMETGEKEIVLKPEKIYD